MAEFFDLLTCTLADLCIYVLNGTLVVAYFLAGRVTMIVSLLCAGVVGLVFDVLAQRLAAAAPARQGQKAPINVSRHHQLLTLACVLSWLVAGSLFPTPVPQLGTAMWALFVVGLLLVPAKQAAILWRSKVAILSYCGLLLAFRIGAAWTLAADAREWARVVGTVDEAQRIVGANRSLILTIASYVAWFGVPVGYAVYLFQRVTAHPMSLRNPLARASEIVYQIRYRPD
jgi:hypothetical protein